MEIGHKLDLFYTILFCAIYTNDAKCPLAATTNGYLDRSCERNPGEVCSFYCAKGFRDLKSPNSSETSNHNKSSIRCNASSSWEHPLLSVCEKIQCSSTIQNGSIFTNCSREYGKYCGFNCDNGFSSLIPNLRCNASGQWEGPTSSVSQNFCLHKSKLCPTDASLSQTCTPHQGNDCAYSNGTGCKQNSNETVLTCSNHKWNVDTGGLCTNCQRCTFFIPERWISNTVTYYLDSNCSYECNYDYKKKSDINHLTCSDTGNEWVPSVAVSDVVTGDDLCVQKQCSSEIPNGHLVYGHACKTLKVICAIQCNTGYFGNTTNIICHSQLFKNGDVSVYLRSSITGARVEPHLLCTNDTHCPLQENWNGTLGDSCTRTPGDECSYACNEGYQSTNQLDQNTITCTSSSRWSRSLSSLCERKRCPETIPNGHVHSFCKRFTKSKCRFYQCDTGFERLPYPYFGGIYVDSSLFCNVSGQWEWSDKSLNRQFNTFCLSNNEFCPSYIKNGRVSKSCRPLSGSLCSYVCNPFFEHSSTPNMVCKNGTWNIVTDMLCTPSTTTTTTTPHMPTMRTSKCPLLFPNGSVVPECGSSPNSSCSLQCDRVCLLRFICLLFYCFIYLCKEGKSLC